jgi:hypothetical protein
MMLRMNGLVRRGGVWQYRRRVPANLQGVIGAREIKRSLGTSDLGTAQVRWRTARADVDRIFAEAEAGRKSPAVAVFKAIEGWRHTNGDGDPASKREIGLDFLLTSLLDREWQDAPLSAEKRAVVEALLKRHENGDAENPPLTLLFDRYYAERNSPARASWSGEVS